MKKRRITLKILLAVLFVIVAYCVFIVINTHSVMIDIQEAATKEEIELGYDSPLVRFGIIEEDDDGYFKKTTDIKRIFTWICGDNGKVWVSCKDRIKHEDGEISVNPDFITVTIKKENGKWKIIKCISPP